jgi:hypothetical protein
VAGRCPGQRRAARSQQIWGWHGWLLLVCGLLAARAAFVLEFAPHYAQPAWAAFDIRDGGWTASVGTIAVLLYGATLWLRRHPLAPAAMVGIAGALALVRKGFAKPWRPVRHHCPPSPPWRWMHAPCSWINSPSSKANPGHQPLGHLVPAMPPRDARPAASPA